MYNPRTSIPFWKRLLKITALTLAFPHSTVCNIVVLWRSETHVIFFFIQNNVQLIHCVVLCWHYFTQFSLDLLFFQPVILHAIQRHLMDPIVIMYEHMVSLENGCNLIWFIVICTCYFYVFVCRQHRTKYPIWIFDGRWKCWAVSEFTLFYMDGLQPAGWMPICLLAQSKHELFAAGIPSRILLNYVKNKPLRMYRLKKSNVYRKFIYWTLIDFIYL